MISTPLSALITLFSMLLCLHPIHVSVTEIEFDEKDQALEVMMRVFIDDLELTLRNSHKEPELDIFHPKNGMTTDQLVGDYLKDHFKISLDNSLQKTNYLGHEREGEAFIFYIEVPGVKKWKTITIHNDIIMATHDDQSNLVHVYVNERVKSLRLTRNTPADKLTFE
ncbi:MAG TPA: DUF6702 family protein [Chryseosolibacter sp.]|nr:DUF6702 family protein [Chryseosolibacter sp.]